MKAGVNISKLFIIILMLLMSVSILNAFEVDTQVYLYYFLDYDYRLHMDGLRLIEMNVELLNGNQEIIDLLINELSSYGPGKMVFTTSSSEEYEELFILCLSIIGNIAKADDVKKIKPLFESESSLRLISQYITTLGHLGDNDKYDTTRLMVKYFKSFDMTGVADDYEFAITCINSFSSLSSDKPLELMDTLGLIKLFKIFMNEDVFSDKIVKFARRKLLTAVKESM